MRFTPALPPFFSPGAGCKTPLLAGAICIALLTSGCASRTILGEKSSALNQTSVAVTPAEGVQTTQVSSLGKFLWVFSPYRPVIQQGNFVSEEMLAQMKAGMTRDQVRFLLGTPLLTDIFHADRWDYPFRLAKGDGETTSSRVVVFFKEGKVEHFEGGNLPTEKEYIARIAGPLPKSAAPADVIVVPTPIAIPVPAPPGPEAAPVTPDVKK